MSDQREHDPEHQHEHERERAAENERATPRPQPADGEAAVSAAEGARASAVNGEQEEARQPSFWQNVRVPDLVKHRIEVVKQQRRLSKRMRQLVRKIVPLVVVIGLGVMIGLNETLLNLFLQLLSFIGQLLFAILFMLVQFGSLFWFMSRSKIERIRPEDPKIITFDDYWGQPRLKRLVRQWLGLLSDRQQFVEMGGRYINGLLLYGPPGTGKTMLAKAMAGEAGVAFISIEGSGFRAMFWGVDVMKMIWFIRKARKLAQRYGAAIAYIDEIDAVAQSRGGVMGEGGGGGGGMGGFMGGGTGALTRLLYEMDGIDSKTLKERVKGKLFQIMGRKPPERNWHVLFMGSTNRPDVIDPALKRPGRFDQLIKVDLPDRTGRREIVDGYLRTVNHDDTVDIDAIVMNNRSATPAQIMAAITKDAVRVALFDHRRAVSQDDIERAFLQQYTGIENPIEEMQEEQRRQVAVHEAGHAVAQHFLMPDTRIAHITIVRRGDALGFVLPMDEVEMYSQPLERIVKDIMMCLAGQAAMRVVFREPFTGPGGGDYPMVRARLWRLYHEGYFGPPLVDSRTGRDSTGGASSISAGAEQRAVRDAWESLDRATQFLLRLFQDRLLALTEALMDHNSLTTKQVVAILGSNKGPIAMPEKLRWQVAVHEAGHAVAQHFLVPETPVADITIADFTIVLHVAVGFVLPKEEVEMYSQPLKRIVKDTMVLLAGQAAMRVEFNESFAGASGGDYPMVRRRLLHLYNEGYFGTPLQRLSISESRIAGEPARLIDGFWKQLDGATESLLRLHEDKLLALAEALMKHNSRTTEQVAEILGPNDPEQLSELVAVGADADGMASSSSSPGGTKVPSPSESPPQSLPVPDPELLVPPVVSVEGSEDEKVGVPVRRPRS